MEAAVTDHVFVDGGHTIDFTNKAFEALDRLGWNQAATVVTTLAHQTAAASRSEESGQWRHPSDLAALLSPIQAEGAPSRPTARGVSPVKPKSSNWQRSFSETTPERSSPGCRAQCREVQAMSSWPEPSPTPPPSVWSASTSRTTTETGMWSTTRSLPANATHQVIRRDPTPELNARRLPGGDEGVPRPLSNIPAARPPAQHRLAGERPNLAQLQPCWDHEGMVDEAGALVYGWLRSGGDQGTVVEELGGALLAEDAEFHWYQTYEAAVRQASAWPEGSEPAALILAGVARFLAAHTPTRRELAQVVRIATRLRRGDALYEEI